MFLLGEDLFPHLRPLLDQATDNFGVAEMKSS